MSAPAADEPLPGFNFRVSWGERQIASISSVSALRLDVGAGEEMQPGPVEFTRARSGDDAFEVWAAAPTPQAVTVAVLNAGGVPSLTFLLEDAVPVSYTALDGLDTDSAQPVQERLIVRCRAIRRVPTPAADGDLAHVSQHPLLQKIDAVTIPVPDLDAGLRFYHDSLGHELLWRNDRAGQAGLGLPGSDTEIVLTTRQAYEPNWLVTSADHAAAVIQAAGGRVVTGLSDIPVGRVAVVADPFGNTLVLLDLSKGHYVTDDTGNVTGVEP